MYGIPVYLFTLGIELQLNSIAQGTIIQFPDNPILREPNILIHSVESYVNTTTGLTKTPGGLTVISQNGGTGLLINFVDDKNQNRIFNHPYMAFNAPSNNGVPREVSPFRMVMQKSSVQVVDGTNLTAGQGIYLVFNYSTLALRNEHKK